MKFQKFWDVTSDHSDLQVSRFPCRKLQPVYLKTSLLNPSSPNSEVSLHFDVPSMHQDIAVSIGACCCHQ